MNEILLITQVMRFAADCHAGHRRKGESREPYVNHVIEVAELVATATKGEDINLVAAALLHDVLEDTEVTRAEMAGKFNTDIADLVHEVTNDQALTKAAQKAAQITSAPGKSDRAKILKLSDKTANFRSILNSPPRDWSVAHKRDYLEHGRQVAEGLAGKNAWLDDQFADTARRLMNQIDGE
ncbi:MAG: HD domain-containing protein [Alphaproteobacteria bacterium]